MLFIHALIYGIKDLSFSVSHKIHFILKNYFASFLQMSLPSTLGQRGMFVFCNPSVLYFCSTDITDRRKSLTIFNPYDFAVRYKSRSFAASLI